MKLTSTAKHPRVCNKHEYEILIFLAVFLIPLIANNRICPTDKCSLFLCFRNRKLQILNKIQGELALYKLNIYV